MGRGHQETEGGERVSLRYVFLWFLPMKSPLNGHVPQCDLLPFWVLVNKKVRVRKTNEKIKTNVMIFFYSPSSMLNSGDRN